MSFKKIGSLKEFWGGVATSLLIGFCWLLYNYVVFAKSSGQSLTIGKLVIFLGIIGVLAGFITWIFRCFLAEKIQCKRLMRLLGQVIKLEDAEVAHYLCEFGEQPFFVWSVDNFQIAPRLFKMLPADFLGRVLVEFLRIKWERINAGREYVSYNLFERLAGQLVNSIPEEYVRKLIDSVAEQKVHLADRLAKAVELLARRREIERIQQEMREIESETSGAEVLRHQLEQAIAAPATPWYVALKWRRRKSAMS